jgi:hypothetical protein
MGSPILRSAPLLPNVIPTGLSTFVCAVLPCDETVAARTLPCHDIGVLLVPLRGSEVLDADLEEHGPWVDHMLG